MAILVIAALLVIAGVVVAITISIRVETGEWRAPTRGDVIRIVRRLDKRPSKTIYLARGPVELRPGEDDAAAGISSVLRSAANKPVKTRGWRSSDARWNSLVACVTQQFAAFNVTVTDQRPTSGNFILVAVGGAPSDIGVKESRVAGLSPFNGDPIPRAVVFAFSAVTNHATRATCETIAMEVGHAYGLDHGYLCKDVMTYLSGCGNKSFVDADVPCGERKHRACEGGAKTQNSFRHLVEVLGARAAR